MPLRLPPWFAIAVKLSLTVVLVALIAAKVDLHAALDRTRQLPLWAGVAALALATAQVVLNAWRWRVVAAAEDGRLTFATALRSVFQGLFFNQALPSVVGGDALRVLRATRAGLEPGLAVRSVVLDRIASMGALVLLAALSQPMFLARVDSVAARGATLGIVVLGVLGLIAVLVLASLPMGWRRFRPVAATVTLSRTARHICARPALLVPIIGSSLAGHVLFLFGVICLADGLGLRIGVADCLAVVPVALLLAMAPVSIAGWGVREGVMVAGLGLMGVNPDGALALSVLMGLVVLASSLPGGEAWLADTVRGRAAALPDPAGARETGG